MNTEEVSKLTGIAHSTVRKYGNILNIKYYGEGNRKIFDWKTSDIPRLEKAIKRPGRKPKNGKK